MLVTINAAHFKAVAEFRSFDKTRPNITGVKIEANGEYASVIATNGHALAVGRTQQDIEDVGAPASFVVPADTVVSILKNIKSKCLSQYLSFKLEAGVVHAYLDTVTLSWQEQTEQYPNWQAVVTHKLADKPVMYDPKLLMLVDKGTRILTDVKKEEPACWVRPGDEGTCGFAQLDEEGDVCAWIMPLRLNMEVMPKPPEWVLG